MANETAKTQFIRYGILNVQNEFLGDYVKNMLSDEKTVNELYQQTLNRKIIEEVKQSADVEEKKYLERIVRYARNGRGIGRGKGKGQGQGKREHNRERGE